MDARRDLIHALCQGVRSTDAVKVANDYRAEVLNNVAGLAWGLTGKGFSCQQIVDFLRNLAQETKP